MITENVCEQIREYASLRYTISQIAIMMGIDVEELRMKISDKDSVISRAYHAGILDSQRKYRESIKKKAESGCVWAITIIEKWERQQKEEELGGYV